MGSGQPREPTIPASVQAWCLRWLGAEPTDVLFKVGHLSEVMGLRLSADIQGRKEMRFTVMGVAVGAALAITSVPANAAIA